MSPRHGHDPDPLILTLDLDGESFAVLDGLRRRLFPPDRNHIPAHLTLFHALPSSERSQILVDLDGACRRQRPIRLQGHSLRSLGRGVAVAFSAPELVRLRQDLSREWRDWLTAQDSARIAPHVTVQNKVSPDEARRTLAALQAGWTPLAATGQGLLLWRYRGGPWELDRRFPFTG